MELNELKLICASNIISLRTSAGLTQAELGAKLNYSDKSVSKWERGEAIPDAFVLKQMAEIFGVTVDHLLSSHDAWEAPEAEVQKDAPQYSQDHIIAVSVLGIWTMALTIFVMFWLADHIWWQIFFIALSLSLLTWLILDAVFKRTKHLPFMIAAFVVSIFVLFYVLMLPIGKIWQIFLIAVPAVVIVYLSCRIKIRPDKGAKTVKK
ncbi:MAG: helix-turn-helix transcriptional regulator [Oscillospiraceae bacterium]|nr:helix-turn-helix transcriptional regulator [Oscillospiraceae bacterium]